ncbi:prolyl 4-hydroxylase subunit alpha-1-like [Drosophila innubila]|uniref:prolyl 4-hydroxylase subunit alpha-1-like n=1 Tax=Drosophila innubila TaxID=198719 RepID=UPI00148BA476|nr:prolyl 4-hydroxylase subunit alpha-1-like [Drosophila innubila]
MENSNLLYSSSVRSMTKLLQMENELLGHLKNYAKEMQQKLDMIMLYQQMLQRPAMHDTEIQENYVANPLNAFPLIRRLQQDWPKWLAYLEGGATRDKINQIQSKLEKVPSEKDLHLAIDGLLRIESFYDLEASHMAKGLLLNNQYNSHLDSADCLALGSHLFNLTEYSKSTHWFRTALRLYKRPYGKLYGQVLGLKRKKLYRAYALAIARETHKSEEAPKDRTPAEWQEIADTMLNQLVLKASSADIKNLIDEYLAGDEEIFIKDRANNKPKPKSIERGCRGLWPKREPHQLTCRYLQDSSAFLRLAPLKIETLNEQPLIVLYHQVLHESEIKALKNASIYQTARDFEKETVKLFPLEDIEARFKHRLNRRILDMLGMDIAGQNLHLFNYGLGGYLPKNSKSTCRGSDTITKPKFKSGTVNINFKERCQSKRIGTMIFYASNVPLGGATVFPKLKLVVQPKKGNALVWLNRNADNEPEKLAEHAVCPIAMGSRWVISNCIDSELNLLDQPCLA